MDDTPYYNLATSDYECTISNRDFGSPCNFEKMENAGTCVLEHTRQILQ